MENPSRYEGSIDTNIIQTVDVLFPMNFSNEIFSS